MRVVIVGRVVASRSFDGGRVTTIVTPAADSYSHPSTVDVRSKQQLGQKGEEVRVTCSLRGFQRRFQYTDSKTGEVKRGDRCEHNLEAVE
jgi:hypothetical protein